MCGLRRSDRGLDCSAPTAAANDEVRGLASLAIGNASACGLRDDGSITCWGIFAEAGRPPESERATQVAVGREICILRADGSVSCFGQDGAHDVP